MPYITTEKVAAIRAKLKAEFPDYKFSVTKERHSSVYVNILSAPINLLEGAEEGATYREVNHYYIADRFTGKVKEVLMKINDIMNETNGELVYDGDYGSVPKYYTHLRIGDYNKPFVLKTK